MDSLIVMVPSVVNCMTLAGAAGLLLFEVVRRLGLSRDHIARCGRALASCGPELVGVGVLLSFALSLRFMGDREVNKDAAEEAVWQKIKIAWPWLLGADTLLGLQAMLRLVAILSARLRGASKTGGPAPTPLLGVAAALFACAGLVRAALNVRTRAYVLDGPLGGDLAVAFEIAVVPFLISLGFATFRDSALVIVSLVAGAAWFASNNYLNLAEDKPADQLFIMAHVLDLLAAFAFLARAVGIFTRPRGTKQKPTGAPVGVFNFIMVGQQALAAYYFLTAFDPSPNLVGAGRPYCLLILGAVAQLGAYLLAAAFCAVDLACDAEGRDEVTFVAGTRTAAEPLRPDAGVPAEAQVAIEV